MFMYVPHWYTNAIFYAKEEFSKYDNLISCAHASIAPMCALPSYLALHQQKQPKKKPYDSENCDKSSPHTQSLFISHKRRLAIHGLQTSRNLLRRCEVNDPQNNQNSSPHDPAHVRTSIKRSVIRLSAIHPSLSSVQETRYMLLHRQESPRESRCGGQWLSLCYPLTMHVARRLL
jgi:hypothetical protein